jgi:hypothetical protein
MPEHGTSHCRETDGKRWARFAEARNVRAGGADPLRHPDTRESRLLSSLGLYEYGKLPDNRSRRV